MKKSFLLFIALCFMVPLMAQTDWSIYEDIVDVYDKDPEELSYLITEDCDTKTQRAEAIYYWVSNNVEFDYDYFLSNSKKRAKRERLTEEEQEERDFKDVERAIKKQKGVSEDYSKLFRALCQYADVDCEMITGWAKVDPKKTNGMGNKHSWNAVKIDGDWQFVDVTYGSGYIDEDERFQFEFEPAYFLVDKEAFNLSHFPKSEKWQMTDEVVDKATYKTRPVFGKGFLQNGVKNVSPLTNIISVKKGIPIELTFEAAKEIKEVICMNLRKDLAVDCELSKTDTGYMVTVDTSKLKNGVYAFMAGEKLLFSYKVQVN